jgi:hypothetical protein
MLYDDSYICVMETEITKPNAISIRSTWESQTIYLMWETSRMPPYDSHITDITDLLTVQ